MVGRLMPRQAPTSSRLAFGQGGSRPHMAIMQPEFEIHSELGQGTARLTLSGELDLATVPRLRAEAQALLDQSARHLIIDLSRLTFVDSSGLSLFISLNDRASRENW